MKCTSCMGNQRKFNAKHIVLYLRVSLKTEDDEEEQGQQLLSTSAPPASLSLLGNFEACTYTCFISSN